MGGKFTGGYGAFSVKGRNVKAHRVALVLSGKPDPMPMLACHTCDVPCCQNPNHLYAGTPSDNMWDRVNRKRVIPHRGADSKASVLSESQVREIRVLYAVGDLSQRQIAANFGVSQYTISAINRRKTWGWLE